MLDGTIEYRVKLFKKENILCNMCNNNYQNIYVKRKFFHLLFIPLFPYGSNRIIIKCPKCKNSYESYDKENRERYSNNNRVPIYFYTVPILFLSSIIIATVGHYLK